MRKIALHWKIFIGLILGVGWGILAARIGLINFTIDWIQPFGRVFINLLMLIAVPLVLVSLIKGVASLSDLAKLSRIGGKTLGLYLITTVLAITIGLILVNIIKPGNVFSEAKKVELKEKYANEVFAKQRSAEDFKNDGPLKFLEDIVPGNIFYSLQDNKRMLQVIFFAILFGIAMISVPTETAKPLLVVFDIFNDVIIKMVEIIIKAAPIGVFALISGLIVEFAGDIKALLEALVLYSISVIIGLSLLIILIYPLVIRFVTGMKTRHFYKGIFPAQLLAFSTSSSAAALPVTMKQCETELGISKEISSFVLPLGATINMDGTSLYQAVAAVFIAQAFGIELTLMQQLTIILTATLASIGSAAVPGAGMVMLVIVLGAIGIDPEGIALIVAVDRPLDMCRTTVNVTGDAMVATIIAKSENTR